MVFYIKQMQSRILLPARGNQMTQLPLFR